MLKIFKYLRSKDWAFMGISLIFIIGQVYLDLKLPDYLSEITKLVQTKGSEMSAILSAGGSMLLCALGSLVATLIVGFFVAQIAAGLSMRLREQLYDKTMSFSMEEMNRFSTASLITRTTNDITQIQTFVAMGLQAIVKAPIMATWAIIKISGKSWELTAVTCCAVGFLILLIGTIVVLVMPKFTKIQKLTDNLNRVTRENLTGIRVVRAYNAEDYQEKKFETANDELTKTNLFANRVMSALHPGMTLTMSGLTLAIYWVGVYLLEAATGPEKLQLFSDMVVFSSYATVVVTAFMMLTMTMLILPRAAASAKRVNEVLDTQAEITDGVVTSSDKNAQGEIVFQNVSFRYPDAEDDILHNISFTARKGETVAFIGATGSGKSTLVNLIPRFYDVTGGEILVDGFNVKEYPQNALRDKIGYVPQKSVLFSGTVRSNVMYGDSGKTMSNEDMVDAVNVAQAFEFVDQMDGKYDAVITQGGMNVSGGQKQRISIARAVCRKPEILIFDDSFSALDYKTDQALRQALKQKMAGITTLIVAQRVGTIMDADKIIVLDEGRIVGQGSHRELMETCAVYREIAESQLSEEELKNA